jgi:hypothetical protein
MPSEVPKKSSEKEAPPVQVRSLDKSFGEQTVLNGINLEVAQGERNSLGPRSERHWEERFAEIDYWPTKARFRLDPRPRTGSYRSAA